MEPILTFSVFHILMRTETFLDQLILARDHLNKSFSYSQGQKFVSDVSASAVSKSKSLTDEHNLELYNFKIYHSGTGENWGQVGGGTCCARTYCVAVFLQDVSIGISLYWN